MDIDPPSVTTAANTQNIRPLTAGVTFQPLPQIAAPKVIMPDVAGQTSASLNAGASEPARQSSPEPQRTLQQPQTPMSSTKQAMTRQSSATLQSANRTSMDALLDGPGPPGSEASPSRTSSAAEIEMGNCPDYLKKPGPKKETVDVASKRIDRNVADVANKLDALQTELSTQFTQVRSQVTQLAVDMTSANPPSAHLAVQLVTTHQGLVELTDAYNKYTEVVDADIDVLRKNVSSFEHRLQHIENLARQVQPMSDHSLLMPAIKRGRHEYDGSSSSTLSVGTSAMMSGAHYAPQLQPHTTLTPITRAPAPSFASSMLPGSFRPISPPRGRAKHTGQVKIGPAGWANPKQEVLSLIDQLPNGASSINKRFFVNPTHEDAYKYIAFNSMAEAQWFVGMWSSSRPQKYSQITAVLVSEN